MRTCSQCQSEKADDEFSWYKDHGKPARRTQCRDCRAEYNKEWGRRKALGYTSSRERPTSKLMLEQIEATDEEREIVQTLVKHIKAKQRREKRFLCANDRLNQLLPMSDPWKNAELKRHCQLLSCASTKAKES